MTLTDHLDLARRRWLSILLCTLLGVVLAIGATLLATPRYTSTTSVLFAVQSANSAGDLAQGSTYAEKQVQSFSEVATAPIVLEPVIQRLGLQETPAQLAKQVSASVPQKTVIIEISVLDADPTKAAAIANAIGDELSHQAANLTPRTPQGQEAVRATIISPAAPATSPTSPKKSQNLLLGLLLGLMLGYGQALVREISDTRVRSDADIERVTDVSIIGRVPVDDLDDHQIAIEIDPLGRSAEAYRRLRTNLQFLNVDGGPRTVAVTSSLPGEGKTTTTINLALALAESGQRVLVIDGDLRRPRLARTLGLESSVGLTTVLIGRAELGDVVQPYGLVGLHVLASGTIPPNPSELLGSRRMTALLDEALQTYDIVLIDTPPLLPVTDAAVLARMVGSTVLVASCGVVHRPELADALTSLESVSANIGGIVLNKVRRRDQSAYAYRYDYTPDSAGSRALGDTADTMKAAPHQE